jgi:hypothetical protein
MTFTQGPLDYGAVLYSTVYCILHSSILVQYSTAFLGESNPKIAQSITLVTNREKAG